MGIFSKIKDNMQKGGVKVKLDAPLSISSSSKSYPMQATLSSKESRTINSLTFSILQKPRPNSNSTRSEMPRNVMEFKISEPFVVLPNQTTVKTHDLLANMSNNIEASEQVPEQVEKFVGMLTQKVQQVGILMFDEDKYEYEAKIIADVDGILIDPSDGFRINIQKPGEITTNYQIRV